VLFLKRNFLLLAGVAIYALLTGILDVLFYFFPEQIRTFDIASVIVLGATIIFLIYIHRFKAKDTVSIERTEFKEITIWGIGFAILCLIEMFIGFVEYFKVNQIYEPVLIVGCILTFVGLYGLTRFLFLNKKYK